MKLHKIAAATAVLSLGLGLAACSSEEKSDNAEATTSAPATTTAAEVAPALPTAADLNRVLAAATDSNLPIEQKIVTVQGGETAPELFEVMARSKEESGADFQVVDPVLAGYAANEVLTSVQFIRPDQPEQMADNVTFVYENGTWKLSKDWACTLITRVVPDQAPAMCADQVPSNVPAPAPAGDAPAPEAPAPAGEGAPAAPEGVAPEGGVPAPAEAPAPAAPAPADEAAPVAPAQ
ncbi:MULTISPECIES: hypothetical protein [unclassified Corynebacterium]|uniref:hypothetical protein n=1 Tax=unclassified Corynebacterium TaxID=2624378 RepID=UPI0029C9C0E7|nr:MULTISPECIES: hypothetical protein [unclassified Corynebacterium]WPF65423.1 hypothetical protein OLX12_07510 [Corynebacterium sp. 22KM0430]WPF67919.1 hypothetical protein OLW90_07505 [Corynebacterium sp. 21KM1197]